MKTALITGATSGIGKATAMALADRGFSVIVHGRNPNKTEQVCEEIKTATGNPHIDFLIADMLLMADVRKLADAVMEKYKRLDVLVNNAGGIFNRHRETTAEGIEKTMAINLLSPFLLTELLLDPLSKNTDARIINVSSNSHQLNAKPDFSDLELTRGYTPLAAYGNAKLFLIWVTQRLANRLKQDGITHISANTMHPGAVSTGFGVNSNLGGLLNLMGKLARPFFKTPKQGADTIVYLATAQEVKGISGKYFVNQQQAKVATKYFSTANEKLIWDYCEQKSIPNR